MNRNLPVLYSFRRCPYAMRARMALRYAGIQVELREVVLSDKPTELIAASPKGTVPVIVFDGEVIEESLDIMLWALGINDPLGWLDCSEEALKLIKVNDLVFKTHLDGYKYAGRNEEETRMVHRSAAEKVIVDINSQLANRSFLLGDKPGLADFSLLPFIRQFANVDINWFEAQPYSRLRKWLRGLLDGRIFADAMSKYPPWKRGDKITVF